MAPDRSRTNITRPAAEIAPAAACLVAPALVVALARLAVLGRPPFTDDG